MAIPAKAYHVEIDGKGYTLLDESYSIQAQRPFSARFSTGDPSFGDLSFWQFLNQEEWNGGEGQEIFLQKNQWLQASGWDMRNNRPQLSFGSSPLLLNDSFPDPSIEEIASIYDDFGSGDLSKWTVAPGTLIGVDPNVFAPSSLAAFGQLHTSAGAFIGDMTAPQPTPAGVWEIDVALPVPINTNHLRWHFILDAGAGYYIHLDGLAGTNLALVRQIAPGNVIVIATAIGAISPGTIKITRNSSGDFEIFSNGVSKLTFTDNTFTTSTTMELRLGTTATGVPTNSNPIVAADNVKIPLSINATQGLQAKTIGFNNEIWIAYPSTNAPFAVTTIFDSQGLTNTPTIKHINATDIVPWSRLRDIGGQNVYLLAVRGSTVKAFKPDQTEVYSATLSTTGTVIAPIDGDRFLVGGTAGAFNGAVTFERITLQRISFAPGSTDVIHADGSVKGTLANSFAIDSNGFYYFVYNDFSNLDGQIPSRLFRFSPTDLLSVAPDFTLTSQEFMPNFRARGLADISGEVYLFGAKIIGSRAQSAIIKLPGTFIYESQEEIELDGASVNIKNNYGIQGIFQHLTGVYFLTRNDAAAWDLISELDRLDAVKEVVGTKADVFSLAEPNPIGVAEFDGHFYTLKPGDNEVLRTNRTRGGFDNTFPATMDLQLSEFGGNTPLIIKALYAVTVELSEALPAADSIDIVINGTVVATMLQADGTEKEFILTASIESGSFNPILRAPRANTWPGYLKKVTLRYIPVQFKKFAWGFAIRAGNNIKLLGEMRDPRTGIQMLDDIKASYKKSTPFTFRDVDGKTFQVIMTDFKGRQPISHSAQGKREYLIPVELLEA